MRTALLLITAALATTAGCLQAPAAVVPAQTGTHGHAPLAEGGLFEGADCRAGGSVTVVPNQPGVEEGVPAPFKLAGTARYALMPEPPGGTIGNWHGGIACEEWESGTRHAHMGSLGLVGIAVEPPAFDELEDVEHNFLVSTFATDDEPLSQTVRNAGFHVIGGLARVWDGITGGDPQIGLTDGQSAWDATANVITTTDGMYTTHMLLEQVPEVPVVRYWLIVSPGDGTLHPAALDIHIHDGTTYMGRGYFRHDFTDKHPGSAAHVPSGALAFKAPTMSARLTVLNATVDGVWAH